MMHMDDQDDVPELIPQSVDENIESEVVNADELPDGIHFSSMPPENTKLSLSECSSEEQRSLSGMCNYYV